MNLISHLIFRSGSTSITGENAQKFGDFVCSENGFPSADFTGVKDEYTQFLKDKGLQKAEDTEQDVCIPAYEVSGIDCRQAKNFQKVNKWPTKA